MANKHILVISQYFYPEQFRINDICKELVKKGNKVTVLAGIPNYPEGKFFDGYGLSKKRKEIWENIEIIRIPLIPRGNNKISLVLNYFSFPFFGYFWNLKNKVKYDLVFMFETSPMNQCNIGVYYKKKHNVPLYLYAQDIWPDNVEVVTGIHNKLIINPIQKMVDKIYKYCDHIFVPSKSFVESVTSRGINSEIVSYLPQYAEDFYKPVTKQKIDDKFTIVFTGNIGYAQGLDILPKCAKLLKEEDYQNKVKFLIVGDGRYKEQLLKEVEEVKEMFEFVGRVLPNEVPIFLAKGDVAFVSFANNPLWTKTIPAKLQSYMACGMPILGSVEGEAERIIREANCGLCSKLGDCEELKNNIILLINSERLSEFTNNSIMYNKKYFDKLEIIKYLENIFNSNEIQNII